MKEYILKKTNAKKLITMGIGVLLLLTVITGTAMARPANTLILDVNPSIELKTNSLRNVVEINPLNEDAKDLIEEYEIKEKNVEDVVEDLIDLMILNGYITGGEDNLVMITVDDNNANKKMVDKVNQAISAYLQNRQLEAAVMSQTIDLDDDDLKVAKEKGISPGKLKIIERVIDNDKSLTYDELDSVSLKDLVLILEKIDIDIEELFYNYISGLDDVSKKDNYKEVTKKDIINEKEAKSIALELADGMITKFKLDEDDGRLEYEIEIKLNGTEHEIEIDAHSGKVIEHEIDDDDYNYDISKEDKYNKFTKKDIISFDEAKSIALELADGKITELELDEDDDRLIYEIEIEEDNREHEIEIDAHSGKVIEHEIDDD